MATVRLRYGEVTLYTRGDSKNWYANFHKPGGGRLQESLKTQNKATAKEVALARYDEIKWRDRLGMTERTVAFAEAADAWLLDLDKQVAAGLRKKRNIVDYAPTIQRYLNPYFAGKTIDSITAADVAKYKLWRRDYWIAGPGKAITSITYVRDGVAVTRPVSDTYRRAPAPRTINGQNVVLRGIFQHAVTQGWMLAAQIPKVERAKQTKRETRERAYRHFDATDYFKLKRFMSLWVTVNTLSERERWRREAVQDYILILLNSGLREHELFKKDTRAGIWRGLRWCDVTRFKTAKDVETVELHVAGKPASGRWRVSGPFASFWTAGDGCAAPTIRTPTL